jgi:hypothetical protein
MLLVGDSSQQQEDTDYKMYEATLMAHFSISVFHLYNVTICPKIMSGKHRVEFKMASLLLRYQCLVLAFGVLLSGCTAQVVCGSSDRNQYLSDENYASPDLQLESVLFPVMAQVLCNETCKGIEETGAGHVCKFGAEIAEGVEVSFSYSWDDVDEENVCDSSALVREDL